MKSTLCLAAVLSVFSLNVFAEKTDTGIYPLPPLPSLPAVNSKITDPTFGSTILRLTDSSDGSECSVQYSYWPTFNVNNTYVMGVCVVGGGEKLKFWTFDPAAFTRGAGFTNNIATPSGWSISPTDAIWSGTDPNVFYGHPVNAQAINASNIATSTNVLIKDLTGSIPAGASIQQMSKSIDDNVFAFNVDNSGGGRYGYIVYRRDTGKVFLQADSNVDEVQIDKTGRYLTVVHNDGSDRIWDLNTNIATDISWSNTGFYHHDSGRGTVFSMFSGNNMGYRSLASPLSVTNLLAYPSGGQDMHFSMLADDEMWGYISRYSSTSANTVTAPYENEIFALATDGSRRVRRIAHHRSVFYGYADAPRRMSAATGSSSPSSATGAADAATST